MSRTAQKLLLLAVVVLMLAAALGWLITGEETGMTSVSDRAGGDGSALVPVAAADGALTSTAQPEAAHQRELVAANCPATLATLLGRVVRAENGTPLAGCTVQLRGRVHTDTWLERHLPLAELLLFAGDALGDAERVRTRSDGCFSFTFAPPAGNWFELEFDADGRVALRAHWDELRPGASVDLGDVAMARGCFVHGEVVDRQGMPQPGVTLTVGRDPSPPLDRSALVRVRTHLETRSGPDGAFAFAGHFVSGSWLLGALERQKLRPHAIVVGKDDSAVTVKVVLLRPEEVETITGRVVDAQGRGIRALVFYSPASGGSNFCEGQRDGLFRIERRVADPRGPMELTASATGYERSLPQQADWGARDLAFVLQPGVIAEVTVRRADSGAPVERFALRLWHGEDPGARERRLQFRGVHPDGVVQLAGLRRGTHTIVVQPADADLLASSAIGFTVDDGVPARVAVLLHSPEYRTVQVRRSDGTPVPGTRVELLEPGSEPVTLRSWAFPVDTELRTFAGWARLLARGSTDAGGEVAFAGPPEPLLALRVLGPGHCPLLVDRVRWHTADGPVRIEVATGATLIGTLQPAAAVAAMWDEGNAHDLNTDAAARERRARMFAPTIMLRRQTADQRENFPPLSVDHAVVERDGTFALGGIPAGTWQVLFWRRRSTSSRSTMSTSDFLGVVAELRDGEVRRFDARIDSGLPAMLAGTVQINGQPLAESALLFGRDAADGQRRGGSAWTDPLGAFQVQLEPGTWRLVAMLGGAIPLPATSDFTLAPGQDLQRDFELHSAELRLRLLRADGTHVAGVPLLLELQAAHWQRWLPATGGDGCTRLDQLPPVPLRVRCRPAALADAAVWRAYEAVHPNDWTNALLHLGEVTPGSDQATVTLPATAGY